VSLYSDHQHVNARPREIFDEPTRQLTTLAWAEKIGLATPRGISWAHDQLTKLAWYSKSYYEMVNRYNDLVTGIIKLIEEHEGCQGCVPGKIEAAEELGLVWRPVTEWSVTFRIGCTDDQKDEIETEFDAMLRDHHAQTEWEEM